MSYYYTSITTSAAKLVYKKAKNIKAKDLIPANEEKKRLINIMCNTHLSNSDNGLTTTTTSVNTWRVELFFLYINIFIFKTSLAIKK